MVPAEGEPAADPSPTAGRTCVLTGKAFEACDPGELQPLLTFLRRRVPVNARLDFARGSLLPDGRLDLCKQRIGPAGAAAVAEVLPGHPQVRHLLLGADGLGDGGAEAIAGLVRDSRLETVYLGCNFITAAGARQLAGALTDHPTVTGLWLKRNPIGDAGVQAVAAALRHNTVLQTLDLTQTELTRTGLAQLTDALARSRVERLYLCGNHLGPDVADVLAALLRTCPALQHLYLSVNRLADGGAAAVASGLRENHSLRTLSLASNGLGPGGAAALADAVGTHPTIAVLELGRQPSEEILGERPNAISDEGAAAFAGALPGHPTLAVLDLAHNGIGEKGAAVLADGLAGNRSLAELGLDHGVSLERRRHIEELLRRNRASGTAVPPRPELAIIRSVYRTAPPPKMRR